MFFKNLTTLALAVELLGCLERKEPLEKVTAVVVGERGGLTEKRKGVLMECLRQVISPTAQAATSRRVQRNQLAS